MCRSRAAERLVNKELTPTGRLSQSPETLRQFLACSFHGILPPDAGTSKMRGSLNLSIAAAHTLRRFRRDRNGQVAIQFAMIAMPFFMMMFAIIETALIFFANQALETATQDTARLIMTGQVQLGGMNAATFKSNLCTRL